MSGDTKIGGGGSTWVIARTNGGSSFRMLGAQSATVYDDSPAAPISVYKVSPEGEKVPVATLEVEQLRSGWYYLISWPDPGPASSA